jgi:hypothetical protein
LACLFKLNPIRITAMRFSVAVLFVCALSMCLRVDGFTVGVLLPDYICHPNENQVTAFLPTGNLPKSLATYLPLVVRQSLNPLTPFEADQPQTNTPAPFVTNTQYILANWHNRNNTAGCEAVFATNTSVTINGQTFLNQIVPGQVHTITLQIRAHDFIAPGAPAAGEATCDVPLSQVTSLDITGLALDGAIIYAEDSAVPPHRVGTFTALGGTMSYNPGCGPWGVGVVHNQLVSGTGIYTGLTWAAPGNLPLAAAGVTPVTSNVTFLGAGVSDAGFGKHNTPVPVVSALPASGVGLSVATPIITYATWLGANLLVFFDPQTTAGVNTQLIAASYTVTVTNAAGTATTTGTTFSSPGVISYATINGAGVFGNNAAITVTANPVTPSATAAQVAATSLAYNVNLPTTPSATVTLTQAASVCNATYLQATAFFNMNQNDNQCSYQATIFASGTVSGVKSAAAPMAAVSVFNTIIVSGVVAAIFSLKRD